MSQRGVERILGKLLTDPEFRDTFFANPGLATLQIGVELTSAETDALRRIPRAALHDFGARLDGRICKLHLNATLEESSS